MMLNIRKILTVGYQRFYLIIKNLVYQENKNAFIKKSQATHIFSDYIGKHQYLKRLGIKI